MFGKMFNLLWQNCIVFGHSFNVLHGQKFRRIKKSPGHTVTELEFERERECVLSQHFARHCFMYPLHRSLRVPLHI